MELKKCPFCGKNILVIAKTCKYCGESLEQKKINVPNMDLTDDSKLQFDQNKFKESQTLTSKSDLPNKSKSNFSKIIFFITTFTIIFIIIIFTIKPLFFKNGSDVQVIDTIVIEKQIVVPNENDSKQQYQNSTEEINNVTNQNAQINGSGVTLRESYSSTSSRITTLKKNEIVKILDSYFPENENEAICTTPISLYTSDGFNSYTLPIGKAVKIISRNDNTCNVMFVHPKYGKMNATINSSDLESISGYTWYKIQRYSGEIGWVISKYIILN